MDPERFGYRDAPLPPQTNTKEATPFIGAAAVAFTLIVVCAGVHGEVGDIATRAVIATSLVVLTAIGYALTRLYAAWRRRHNARLELEWERWLDSADACKVGPRKWTK